MNVWCHTIPSRCRVTALQTLNTTDNCVSYRKNHVGRYMFMATFENVKKTLNTYFRPTKKTSTTSIPKDPSICLGIYFTVTSMILYTSVIFINANSLL